MDISSTRKEFSSRTHNTLHNEHMTLLSQRVSEAEQRVGLERGSGLEDSGEGRERRRHDSGDRCPVYKDKVLRDKNVVRSLRTLEDVDREVEGSFIFLLRF